MAAPPASAQPLLSVIGDYRETRMTEPRTIRYTHYGRERTREIPPLGERAVNVHVGTLKTMLNWAAGGGGGVPES